MSSKIIVATVVGLAVGYYIATLSRGKTSDSYIDYCTDYKICVNSKNSDIAQHCGKEVQLKYPELFVK